MASSPVPFGIEVKHLDIQNSRSERRGLRGRRSTTVVLDRRPGSPSEDRRSLQQHVVRARAEAAEPGGETYKNDWALWTWLRQLANHANVCILDIRGNRDAYAGWKVAFSGGTHFSCRAVSGEVTYMLSNINTIEKNRIGSF
jgi:hypothetical protein